MKKDQKTDIRAKDLLALIKKSKKSINIKEIYTIFKANKVLRKKIRSLLKTLVASGQVFRFGKVYSGSDSLAKCQGQLEIHRGGGGFVLQQGDDIYIRATDVGDAWHGDEVEVFLFPRGGRRRPEGKITRVIKRQYSQLPVRVSGLLGGGLIQLAALDWRIRDSLAADPSGVEPAPSRGDILLVRPGEKMSRGLWKATILRHLGDELDVRVQEQMVKASQRVPLEFPQPVLDEARKLPDIPDSRDMAGRKDLRDQPFVTIDGETAKDFDDAILVTETRQGFVLNVAIADVAHYVRPGSELDKEALVRGNSWYFPCSVEPMLPQALSNGLCSLNPDEDRLVLVARMLFKPDGSLERSDFFEAVIKSAARLTYAQVEAALARKDKAVRKEMENVLQPLETAWKLAGILLKKRAERGSIEFDLPELQIDVDENGQVQSLAPALRFFSHRLIELFMVAANEAVAEFLEKKEAPCLYRIHPEPDEDRLNSLFVLLRQSSSPLGQSLPIIPKVESLHKLLEDARGDKLEFLINRLLLRTMMQAKYSAENSGHFGLASSCYCHFTSPIRRYADLVVHRSLKAILHGKRLDCSAESLQDIALGLNACERRAMVAEREMNKRCAILFLRNKIGKTFTGVISSFSDYGFWVELNEVVADGMVRLSSLRDDYYAFLPKEQIVVGERTGRTFHLGQAIEVQLKNASLSLLEIELELTQSGNRERKKEKRTERKKEKGKKKKKNIFLDRKK